MTKKEFKEICERYGMILTHEYEKSYVIATFKGYEDDGFAEFFNLGEYAICCNTNWEIVDNRPAADINTISGYSKEYRNAKSFETEIKKLVKNFHNTRKQIRKQKIEEL